MEFVRNLLGRQVQVQLLEDQKSHKINFIAVIQIVSYVLHCHMTTHLDIYDVKNSKEYDEHDEHCEKYHFCPHF